MIEQRGERSRIGARSRMTAALAAICLGLAAHCGTAHAAPTVSVTEPAAGAAVTGMTTFGADASSEVVAVKWYVDGIEVAVDGDGAPWSSEWDTAHIAAGAHRVFAKARDAAGS